MTVLSFINDKKGKVFSVLSMFQIFCFIHNSNSFPLLKKITSIIGVIFICYDEFMFI